MGLSVRTAANAIAWAVIIGLIGVAFFMVLVLGPFALVLLGLFTMFVCAGFTLRYDGPTWGREVFKARMNDESSQGSGLPGERKNTTSCLQCAFFSGAGWR
jgi:hypothetical protein